MATKVGMYSATHESVTVARGQKQENTKKKKTNTVRATNIYEVHDRTEKRVDCKYLPLSHTKP